MKYEFGVCTPKLFNQNDVFIRYDILIGCFNLVLKMYSKKFYVLKANLFELQCFTSMVVMIYIAYTMYTFCTSSDFSMKFIMSDSVVI